MGSKYGNLIYLLPVSRPKNCKSFLEWKPFSKDTLSEIIDNYNNKCVEYYENCDWHYEDIRESVPIISLYVYDPLKLSTIGKKAFEQIQILIVDLDTLNCSNEDVKFDLKNLKSRMGQIKHYFVLSIGRNQNEACKDLFKNLFEYSRVIPFGIFREQSDLENFFSYFGRMNVKSAEGAENVRQRLDKVSTDLQIKPEWDRLDIIKILNEIRDAAMLKGLSEPSKNVMESLAYNTIINEQAISKIKEEQSNKNNVVDTAITTIMDPIRQADKIPITPSLETPEFESFHMLNISLNRNPDKLTNKQSCIAQSLGFEEKDSFAIFFDEPNIRNTIGSLKGAVKISKFIADLPDWNK